MDYSCYLQPMLQEVKIIQDWIFEFWTCGRVSTMYRRTPTLTIPPLKAIENLVHVQELAC